jgi:hypothetical protein
VSNKVDSLAKKCYFSAARVENNLAAGSPCQISHALCIFRHNTDHTPPPPIEAIGADYLALASHWLPPDYIPHPEINDLGKDIIKTAMLL